MKGHFRKKGRGRSGDAARRRGRRRTPPRPARSARERHGRPHHPRRRRRTAGHDARARGPAPSDAATAATATAATAATATAEAGNRANYRREKKTGTGCASKEIYNIHAETLNYPYSIYSSSDFCRTFTMQMTEPSNAYKLTIVNHDSEQPW